MLPAIESLPPELRRRIAEEWSRDALLEHASVASFSRFSLHLMAVAAPPDLLRDAHLAAMDEIEHARSCFHIAGLYHGQPIGPGPLPLEGDVLGDADLGSIVASTVREGCVGETLAALEAAAASESAEVGVVREALAKIADDETRHAELAWRFVRWALAEQPALADGARAVFGQALADDSREPLPDPDAATLARHGRLDARAVWVARRRGRLEVLAPAVHALFGR